MRHNPLLIILLLLLSAAAVRGADDYKFRSFMTTDGLSDNSVLCGLRDRYGFVWLGTANGLNCFDGRTSVVYHNFPSISSSSLFGSDAVVSLMECGNDIYFGCNDGAKIYHRATGTIEPFRTHTRYGVVISSAVQAMLHAANGWMWLGTLGQGLFLYNPHTGTLVQNSRYGGFVSSICQTADRRVAVAFLNGTVNVFTQQGRFCASYKIPGYASDKNMISMQAVGRDLWVGTDAGLYRIDRRHGTVTGHRPPFYVGTINSIAVRDAATLLLGTRRGVFTFAPATGAFARLDGEGGVQQLTDTNVNQLQVDSEGTLWVFTAQGGVSYLPRHEVLFKYHALPGVVSVPDRSLVYAFVPAGGGDMWIGATSGLMRYTRATGTVAPFRRDIIHTSVRALLRDGQWLWIGTAMDGLKRLNLVTGELREYHYSEATPYTLPSNEVNAIYKTAAGDLFVATSWSLCRYDPSTERFLLYASVPSTIEFVDICGDREGNVWAATKNSGLYRYTARTGVWRLYSYSSGNPHSLPVNTLTAVTCDSRGRVWVATRGGGLCQYDGRVDGFRRFHGVSDIVNFVCEDSQHNLWVATERALLKIGGKNPAAVQVDSPAELWRGLFMQRAVSYSPAGDVMFIGNTDGFYTFRPLLVKETASRPVYITAISLPYASDPERERRDLGISYDLYVRNRVVLPYRDNSFTLHFSSPHFSSAQGVLFDYMLKGVDKQWAHNVSTMEATYANVPSGEYEFLLREAGGSGPVAHVFIRVLPPWYLAWWAFVVYAVAAAIVACLVWQYTKRTLRRRYETHMEQFRAEQEKQVFQSKINFFVNIVHEIRTPLSLIVLPLERLGRRLHGTDESKLLGVIGKNVDYLLNMTNQLLDFQKVENGKVTLHRADVSLAGVVADVQRQFASYCEVEGKTLVARLPDADVVTAIDRSAVNKIMMNLMSNALKYARTSITVSLSLSADGRACLSVADDGPGVPDGDKQRIFETFYQVGGDKIAQMLGSGIGLAFAKALATAHGGDLRVDDAPGGGSCFSLLLPMTSVGGGAGADAGGTPAAGIVHVAGGDTSSHEEARLPEGERFAVLLVEDNAQLLDMTGDMLGEWYHVLRARNGAEALEVMDSAQVDVVVSDVMMPVMDGIALCAKVKGDINYSHIPLILLTAKTTIEAKVEGMKSGADVYLEKPFAIEQLHMQIENLLRLRQHFYKHMSQADGAIDAKAASECGINRQNMAFLTKVQLVFADNMANEAFGIDDLAGAVNMSRSSFYRKIKSLTGVSPVDFMRTQRLKRAASLLLDGGSVADVAAKVGFSTASYFTKCFKQAYGMLPRDYVASRIAGGDGGGD